MAIKIVKKILNKWRGQVHPQTKPATIISRDQHNISRQAISENALKVLYRLKKAGYSAYLVGGSVRDLLLGGQPKDFDVATDARPEDVRALFSNCRLIGRRFRLAHVYFRGEIIEVATFRAAPSSSAQKKSATSHNGMLLRDNVYGQIEEDVWRRDFTINTLYYNIADFSVVDFTNGMADLKKQTIQILGNPSQRYREDPVRMLRALRFAAKLNFSIHPNTAKPIYQLSPLLDLVSPARLFEEMLKLFLSGHGQASYQLLKKYDLFSHLFPESSKAFSQHSIAEQIFLLTLQNTDQRIQQKKPVTPAFLLAALLWQPLQTHFKLFCEEGEKPYHALQLAMDVVIKHQSQRIAAPKKFTITMREIWRLQNRLEKRNKYQIHSILNQPRFRAAYDLLILRVQAGEPHEQASQWWTTIQTVSEEEQEQMILRLNSPQKKRRKPRKKRREA